MNDEEPNNVLLGPHNGARVLKLLRTHQNQASVDFEHLSDQNKIHDAKMEGVMQDMINDWFMDEGEEETYGNFNNQDDEETYNKVKKEVHVPIYSGAKISKLSATLLLLNLQTTYGWSDNYVNSIHIILH